MGHMHNLHDCAFLIPDGRSGNLSNLYFPIAVTDMLGRSISTGLSHFQEWASLLWAGAYIAAAMYCRIARLSHKFRQRFSEHFEKSGIGSDNLERIHIQNGNGVIDTIEDGFNTPV